MFRRLLAWLCLAPCLVTGCGDDESAETARPLSAIVADGSELAHAFCDGTNECLATPRSRDDDYYCVYYEPEGQRATRSALDPEHFERLVSCFEALNQAYEGLGSRLAECEQARVAALAEAILSCPDVVRTLESEDCIETNREAERLLDEDEKLARACD